MQLGGGGITWEGPRLWGRIGGGGIDEDIGGQHDGIAGKTEEHRGGMGSRGERSSRARMVCDGGSAGTEHRAWQWGRWPVGDPTDEVSPIHSF